MFLFIVSGLSVLVCSIRYSRKTNSKWMSVIYQWMNTHSILSMHHHQLDIVYDE